MIRLRQMSVFAHIVETGSITAASELLELSKSVVSQHLKSLENELGIVLLKRTTRKQTLTVAGKQFYQQCKILNQVANDAWLEAQQSKAVPQGKIRITAPNALMETLVAPAIARLLPQYPLLKPELISHDHHLSLMSENIDLAIRVGQSKESTLKQKRIGEFRDVLCGKPEYIASRSWQGLAYIANTWQGHEICHQFHTQVKPAPLSKKQVDNQTGQTTGELIYAANAHCITNSFHTCLSLIKSASGIGIIPDFHLRSLSSELVEVFPEYQLPLNTIYALHPFGDQTPLSVNVCLQAIMTQLNITTTA